MLIEQLRKQINDIVYDNDVHAITGGGLNGVLQSIVNALTAIKPDTSNDDIYILDSATFDYNKLKEAYEAKKLILYKYEQCMLVLTTIDFFTADTGYDEFKAYAIKSNAYENGNIVIVELSGQHNEQYGDSMHRPVEFSWLYYTGDGLAFLANDGNYKPLSDIVPYIHVRESTISHEMYERLQATNTLLLVMDSGSHGGELCYPIKQAEHGDLRQFWYYDVANKQIIEASIEIIYPTTGGLPVTYKYSEVSDDSTYVLNIEAYANSPATEYEALRTAIANGKLITIATNLSSPMVAVVLNMTEQKVELLLPMNMPGDNVIIAGVSMLTCTNTDVVAEEATISLRVAGDGTKFLSDDGTYKTLNADQIYTVDLTKTTIPYEELKAAILAGKVIAYASANTGTAPIIATRQQDNIRLVVISSAVEVGDGTIGIGTVEYIVKPDSTFDTIFDSVTFLKGGDGTKFLSDDGTYKELAASPFVVPSDGQLPATGETNKIYLIPATDTASQNIMTEYVYVNGAWEKFGEAKLDVDMTGVIRGVSLTMTDNQAITGASYAEVLAAATAKQPIYVNGTPCSALSYDSNAIKLISMSMPAYDSSDNTTNASWQTLTINADLSCTTDQVSLDNATQEHAGLMSAEDKRRLDEFTGLGIVKLTNDEYQALVASGTASNDIVYIIVG